MRILVVEDDYKIGNALKKGLEQESYAVDLETDGETGLSSAQAINYDLIILDRMLPGGIDGLQIAQKLRISGQKTSIIMLTAKDAIADRVDGLDAGANDYLVKPFAFEELLARVRTQLRKDKSSSTSIIIYADLSVNTKLKTVERQNKSIDLTAKEYALLNYFMHNPEVILSKQQIMEHVWNFDADILPNNVEAYVGYLRTKLEKPFKNSASLIQTKRGFGYILKATK